MQIGPFEIAFRKKALQLQPLSGRGGWWSVIRDPYMGAWQRNDEVHMDTVLTFSAVFACVTLIASDIAKLRLRLVAQDADGIWSEAESPSFSPVLRKPNRYQNRIKFIEQWVASKLIHGNTYVLKQRDNRKVVTALYVLDPSRVTPLVATDGAVYYELRRDDLSDLPQESITVPASEIIHDTMVALYHPLVGMSPLYACGAAAMQGLSIQSNSTKFFGNGSNPGGVLSAPGAIADETAARLKAYWDANYTGDNVGKVAVLGDGLSYQSMSVNAVDAQLIEQLKWTGDTVCSCFHVPAYMVGIGPPPPYANVGPLLQQYYNQCLQSHIGSLEICLDEGLELPKPYGTEFDLDDLIWMDAESKNKAAADGIGSGGLSPDEARKKYHGLGPVRGGDSPYLQQQYYSLAALAQRDADQPFAKPTPAPAQIEAPADEEDDDVMSMAHLALLLTRKSMEADCMATNADALSDLIVMTIKHAVAPLRERIAVLEAALRDKDDHGKVLAGLWDRALETKSTSAADAQAVQECARRIAVLEQDRDAGKDVASQLRERVGVLEVKGQIPGPAGNDGTNGKDGLNGADGLGFDDVSIDFDGARTMTVKFEKGGRQKSFPLELPFLRYREVFKDGETYYAGDVVTWGGSSWHCQEQTTSKPGDGATSWRLMVKRGRDGKDGGK